ncbi:response regulator [Thalassospira sp. GO-4]|jgi:FixJ family two-component response regulator|uniref:response regulator transcription factor n=1 Tax=unclassified Thalassospira TaxID=2648997 RepID=UPI0007AD77BC|nr:MULTISPECIES: response regulator [unclassified Thalassospira]KZB61465.1 two-component system response regulator [Thalassospira sp. MCCC 1A02491]URK17491.1 response regulator [Thalassospira sp. GO-4]
MKKVELSDIALNGSVYVIDDDAAIRDAVSSLLRSIGFAVSVFETVPAFLEETLPDNPACLVLDVRLPGIGGLDFQGKLKELGVSMPVIFMTGFGDVPMSVKAMKAGAIDFLSKPFRDQDLIDAVIVALDLDRKRRIDLASFEDLVQKFNSLTHRERQAMMLVSAGLMNKQIAGELNLSEVTVKIHRGTMMKKLEMRSVADLVRTVELLKKHGVIEDD